MTGWPPQQASSAMTMRAGQPALAAEQRGPGVAAGLRGAGAGMSLRSRAGCDRDQRLSLSVGRAPSSIAP